MKTNPFEYGNPITHPSQFFGRKNELIRMQDSIRQMRGISVVGERRVGKSSLLKVLSSLEIIQEDKVSADTAIPAPSDPGMQPLIQQAKEDLAKRLGINVDEIELTEAKFVVWPDKGLGCPRPGMIYPQVQQDGAFIQLKVGSQSYNYHSGGNRSPFLCEKTRGKAAGEEIVPPPNEND